MFAYSLTSIANCGIYNTTNLIEKRRKGKIIPQPQVTGNNLTCTTDIQTRAVARNCGG